MNGIGKGTDDMTDRKFSSLTENLDKRREQFLLESRSATPGLLAASTFAQNLIDAMKGSLAPITADQHGWAVIALGELGKGKLSIFSSLDLFFLYHGKLLPAVRDAILPLTVALREAGFEVTVAKAPLFSATRLAHEDFSTLGTRLDARFILGDRPLFDEWRRLVQKNFGKRNRVEFLKSLREDRDRRLTEYGDNAGLLEPNVKEGIGGLRDLDAIRWTGIACLNKSPRDEIARQDWISPEEEHRFLQAHDFLWRTRLQLHQLTSEPQDFLLFSEQERIAKRLGFPGNPPHSSVDAFMRLYHLHSAHIRDTTTLFLERIEEIQSPPKKQRRRVLSGPFLLEGSRLQFLEPEWIALKPGLLMLFFWQLAKSEAHFDYRSERTIGEHLRAITDKTRKDPEVIGRFMEILTHQGQPFPVLQKMMETGFLEAFLPEFADIRHLAQHGIHNLYTVGEHLLRTVKELHRMERPTEEPADQPRPGDIFQQIRNRRILFLAGLLHDIGKGQGSDHSVRGAALARKIGNRLGLGAQEVSLLVFLVENHLLLIDTALKGDLADGETILRCALHVGAPERLRLLYLLSIADSSATGPGCWNEWKASLLSELYKKVEKELTRGGAGTAAA
jgi:[protein-PII] uridylyltransferase